MNKGYPGRLTFLWKSVKNVYALFFYMGKKAKKTKIFYLISFLPVLMALIIILIVAMMQV